MINKQVHVAIQIVPISKGHPYPIIDKAIAVIQDSGVDFKVGAMETVMQGDYNKLMKIVEAAQVACLEGGADEIVVTMKVHAKKDGDVTWEEKLSKY
ncbi:MAG TPA: thiamine-binding protein [Chryseolinea sp.]|nr:thiamine-binding protein [Chryseolinea sp.]